MSVKEMSSAVCHFGAVSSDGISATCQWHHSVCRTQGSTCGEMAATEAMATSAMLGYRRSRSWSKAVDF